MKHINDFNTHTRFEDMFNNDDYASSYNKIDYKYKNWYSDSADILCELSNIDRGMSVLEIGSGTGLSTKKIIDRVGDDGHVIATEYGRSMFNILNSKYENNENVDCYRLDAKYLDRLISSKYLTNKMDVVISSFTYFYVYKFEDKLYQDILSCLKEDGRLAFNITSFLTPFDINGKKYNSFYYDIINGYDTILKDIGYKGIGKIKNLISNKTFDIVSRKLIKYGFKNVDMIPYEMPFLPSQALNFMINEFYKYGSNIPWSSTLNNIPLNKRMDILKHGLDIISKKINSYGQRPTIVNVIAKK